MAISAATWNVLQLGAAFFFNFFAFNSQGFIEESVISSASDRGGISKHAGYYSLAIIYAVCTVGNFVAAPIINALSPRIAMALGCVCYAVFQAGFLFLNEIFLYFSSALLGFGASVLWAGQGAYLSQNCNKENTGRNSAIVWAMGEGSLMIGGIFLFLVFRNSDSADNISVTTVRVLYSVFAGLTLLAATTLFLLRHPIYPHEPEDKPYLQRLGGTFKLMATKQMLLLAFVFAYTGIEQAFWTGIYPTCISFTKQLGSNTNSLLALNSICAGAGQIVAGFLFGALGSKTKIFGRDGIVLLGAFMHTIVYGLIYINFPADAPLHDTDGSGTLISPNVAIALVAGGLLGFGDACWNTQIYSLLVEKFPGAGSEAFAVFRFYQAGLSCTAFLYSSVLQLQWHLAILMVALIVAAGCFFVVENYSFESTTTSTSTSSTAKTLKPSDDDKDSGFTEIPTSRETEQASARSGTASGTTTSAKVEPLGIRPKPRMKAWSPNDGFLN